MYCDPGFIAPFRQVFHISFAAFAEIPIFTSSQTPDSARQQFIGKDTGFARGKLARKLDDNQKINAKRIKDLHFVLHRREDPARCAIRRENLHGMRFKSEHSGASTPPRGVNHAAVPQMNPIEYSKSQTEI